MPTSDSVQDHYAQTPIGAARPLKVIVIGAGISGILNAIKLPQQLEKLDLVIYEKNTELGGTWWENRYPGVACGMPARLTHSQQQLADKHPRHSSAHVSALLGT